MADPAVWSIACYRLGNWLNVSRPFLLIRLPLKVVSFLANKFCEVVMEMQISSRATIGEGLFIGHIGGVVIHPEAVIGRNCDIAHRVTIEPPPWDGKAYRRLASRSILEPARRWLGESKLAAMQKSRPIPS